MLPDELDPAHHRSSRLGMVLFLLLVSTLAAGFVFVAGVVEIDGESMEPALQSGSRCVVYRVGDVRVAGWTLLERSVEVGDVVIAQFEEDTKRPATMVKRVVALGGEALPASPWLQRFRLTKTAAGRPQTLPGLTCRQAGCFVAPGFAFLVSDQPSGTLDSRQLGAVPLSAIRGQLGGCL